jgi:two-component system CheB/CheR fusion protein
VDELRRLQEHQKLLLAELQHRVRNMLAVVRSIARRTASTSESVEDYSMHFDGRLNAFARTQAVVTRAPAAGVDLEYLIVEELLAHAAHEGEQVSIAGPEIRLRPKAAETLGLAMHELTTNAVKYGALSTPGGRLAITWRLQDMEGQQPETASRAHLVLEWVESGVVPLPPRRRGFGTELIERMLNYEFGAEAALAFGPDGARCTIDLPLNDRVVMSRAPEAASQGR